MCRIIFHRPREYQEQCFLWKFSKQMSNPIPVLISHEHVIFEVLHVSILHRFSSPLRLTEEHDFVFASFQSHLSPHSENVSFGLWVKVVTLPRLWHPNTTILRKHRLMLQTSYCLFCFFIVCVKMLEALYTVNVDTSKSHHVHEWSLQLTYWLTCRRYH